MIIDTVVDQMNSYLYNATDGNLLGVGSNKSGNRFNNTSTPMALLDAMTKDLIR